MTPVPEGESCSGCGLTAGTYIPSPHHIPPGTVLMDRYLVGRVLGEGGFGITYIGRDLRLELKVAIKEYYPVDRATRNAAASLEVTNFIGPSGRSFERGKQKFLDEAQTMARMDKQQVIVSVRDFFEINNTAYIVMEYVEGITFHELVEKKGGKIPPEELFPMIEPLFQALFTMHENGLIHRDISPDNLMLENGRVRLLDFGCAREASRGTETMTIALKHGYAPIEQYQQKGQGPWTDIYALSATIYYCLTGKIPPQALDRITEDELLLPTKLGIPLSTGQEKALLKGMSLQPNRRFPNAEELWSALYEKSGKVSVPVVLRRSGAGKRKDSAAEAKKSTGIKVTAKTGEETEPLKRTEGASEPAARTGDKTEPVTETGKTTESAAGICQKTEAVEGIEGSEKPVGEIQAEIIEDTGSGAILNRIREVVSDRGRWIKLVVTVCVVMIVIAGVYSLKSEQSGPKEMKKEERKSGNTTAIDQRLFDDAAVFTSGDVEELKEMMEDGAVSAIRIECGVSAGELSVAKPVKIEKDAYFQAEQLTVTEDGCLDVEGHLDMTGSSYIRLMGSGVRLFVSKEAEVSSDDGTFLWMDHADCLSSQDGAAGFEHELVFSVDVFDGTDVVSVTDYRSLKRAAERGITISIDADLTLEDYVSVTSPVRISEGVTVHTKEVETEMPSFIGGDGGVIVNEGTLCAPLNLGNDGAFINRGRYTNENNSCDSFWIEGKSVMVNEGTVEAENCSRFWEGSLFINQGEFQPYDFYLCGGIMANFGNVVMQEKREPEEGGFIPYFGIQDGSRLENKGSGLVTIPAGTEICNNGVIRNVGSFVVKSGGTCNNVVFENIGSFMAENGADLDPQREGIYFGPGQFEMGNSYVTAYHTSDLSLPDAPGKVQVKNIEELEAALNDPAAEAVYIGADIDADSGLAVSKPLIIEPSASLTMADGAELTAHGSAIVIRNRGSLCGANILLSEGAYICNEGDLTIKEGGSLNLDGALLCGKGGGLQMKKAGLILKNRAGFACDGLSSFEAEGGEILLQDTGVFAMPYFGAESLSDVAITLERDSYFYSGGREYMLKECRLDIGIGVFQNSARNLTFENCTIDVGAAAEFSSDFSSLALLGQTVLNNAGKVSILGWDEYTFTGQGIITNTGDLTLSMTNTELSEPIQNQGNLYLWAPLDNESIPVNGNAPIIMEQ